MLIHPISGIKPLVLSGMFFTLLFTGCASEKKADTATGPKVYPVTQPLVLDTVYQKEYVTDIQSPQHVELRARVRGFLEKIHVDEGQEVQQGQLLFTLSGQEFREELRKANALLKSALAEAKMAEVEAKNTRLLVDKNVVSQSELAVAEAKLEAIEAKIDEAKADVSAAELNLSFAQVKAPFSGIINRIPNKQGSLIEEGTLLTSLSSNHSVFAYFNVSEKEYLEFIKNGKLQGKNSASLLLANGEMHTDKGTVETAETVIDKNTGSIAFRARFPNKGHVLKHGATGKVALYETLKNAVVIPQKSTFEVQDKLYLYVVGKDNKVERRSFVPKVRLSQLYVVESGLSPNEQFIYEGIQSAAEGEVITPDLQPMRKILAQLAMQ